MNIKQLVTKWNAVLSSDVGVERLNSSSNDFVFKVGIISTSLLFIFIYYID